MTLLIRSHCEVMWRSATGMIIKHARSCVSDIDWYCNDGWWGDGEDLMGFSATAIRGRLESVIAVPRSVWSTPDIEAEIINAMTRRCPWFSYIFSYSMAFVRLPWQVSLWCQVHRVFAAPPLIQRATSAAKSDLRGFWFQGGWAVSFRPTAHGFQEFDQLVRCLLDAKEATAPFRKGAQRGANRPKHACSVPRPSKTGGSSKGALKWVP